MEKDTHKYELGLLYKYALECNFIIETGGGKSTKYLAKAALENNSKFITIEKDKCPHVKGAEHMRGWSITYKDMIKYDHPDFKESVTFHKPKYLGSKYKRIAYGKNDCKKYMKKVSGNFLDGVIAHGCEKAMKGENDLIRKALKKYDDMKLDFFFCDTGEYCGLAEWNIVQDEIIVGGYFACHDIYYPKSIKCYQILKQIKKSDKWEILEKTKSKQGLLIARKIKK